MPEQFALDDFPCELLLNGMSMHSVGTRRTSERAGDFDIVVTDLVLGAFSLHSGFEIDIRGGDASWRRVSLNELKAVLRKSSLLRVADLPKASEIAECQLFARVDDIEFPDWESGGVSNLGREEACVRYVQRVLYRVGIPHLVAGTTFTVPSASTARIPLKRAGFRRSAISRSALVEPRTNVTVQLVQREQRR
jgi:hypothetical protein